jgi:ribosomal protein S21
MYYKKQNNYNSKTVARTSAERFSSKPVITIKPIEVLVRSDSKEDLEKAIRIFKRKVMEEDIIGQVRERRAYKKPSEKRRAKMKKAVVRARVNRFTPVDNDKEQFNNF